MPPNQFNDAASFIQRNKTWNDCSRLCCCSVDNVCPCSKKVVVSGYLADKMHILPACLFDNTTLWLYIHFFMNLKAFSRFSLPKQQVCLPLILKRAIPKSKKHWRSFQKNSAEFKSGLCFKLRQARLCVLPCYISVNVLGNLQNNVSSNG